ncbi:hypothetical protein [Gordonia sp. NPDC058843]|uniref:hypothetical protein n=1 Tax=Gordonia sp. NPDC058843 TaxID=3346648 RepID=UPI0036AC5D6F
MTAPSDTFDDPRVGNQRTRAAWALGGLELFVALAAIGGGSALIADRWAMPREWLANTPFGTWAGPGVALIAAIAMPHLVAAAAVVVPSVPARPGIFGGLLAGGSLIAWIVLQVALLRVFFFLQPVMLVVGVVEIALALWWRRDIENSAARPPRGQP